MNQKAGAWAVAILLIAACAPLPRQAAPTILPTAANDAGTPAAETTATPTQSVHADKRLASQLEAAMAALQDDLSFTGAVLVARDGKVLLSRGYGLSDRQEELPNGEQTQFRIGSITKQFTATAILMLQERGQLDVRERVCAYLPDCPAAWQAITIHQILTHTSGLGDYKDLPDYAAFRATPAAPAQLIARFADLRLVLEPGSGWRYSNSGYVVLGNIIERLSGMTYKSFLKENILTPLDMNETGLLAQPRDLARGYENSFTSVPAASADASVEYAAGGLYTTVGDLYLYDRALFSDQLIASDLRGSMTTPYAAVPDSDGVSYGYGCQVTEMDGHWLVGHGGLLEGYSSMNMYFPDDKVAVILLGNQRNPPVSSIGITLARMVLQLPY